MANKDAATQYAIDVVEGKVIACKQLIQSCQRHLNDLERSKSDDYPYTYNVKKAEKAINFMNMLPDPATGKPMKLARFQVFIVSNIFGWVYKDTGYRKYNKALISMARKGGKSILISGVCLYELLFGKYPKFDKQIFTTANSREQASIVFKMIKNQLMALRKQSKSIRKLTKIVRNEITVPTTQSVLKPLSKDTSSLDGLNVLISVHDEQHENKNTDMIELMESSQSQQRQGLILQISTVGFDMNLPFYFEYKYAEKILNNEEENENYFAIIFTQDSEEEINDERMWIKSNPLLENEELKEIILKNLRKKLHEALGKNDLSGTLVKNFNIWQQATKNSFLKAKDWEVCKVDVEPDLCDKDVYIGVDLSRTTDLSSISYIVPVTLDEKDKFYVNSHSWVGTKEDIETKSKKDKIDYRKLELQGYCSISKKESGLIDYQEIIDYINEKVEQYRWNVKGIYYDEYSAVTFVTELEDKYDLVSVRQGYKTLSPPTKQFQLDVYEQKIAHTDNPLLNIAINNSITVEVNDAVKIDKTENRRKIDPLAAMINAYTEAMYNEFNSVDLNEFFASDDFSF
ncbi:terminase large subunit [Rummeliibacillus stabekisii]|uniref:terminase large subunit n=1 Tax=Rummeliibacillus stabekisii TaxID=241244 RepID=UPI003719C811